MSASVAFFVGGVIWRNSLLSAEPIRTLTKPIGSETTMMTSQSVTSSSMSRLVYVAVFLMAAMVSAEKDEALEQARIQFLLDSIARLDGAVFIRNGTEHSAIAAAEHLANKLSRAQKSFFAPPKSDWTAEMFIEKLATKSSMSGQLYKIRFADGREMAAGDWLKQQLRFFSYSSFPGSDSIK